MSTPSPLLPPLHLLASGGPTSDRADNRHQPRALALAPVPPAQNSRAATVRVLSPTDRHQQT